MFSEMRWKTQNETFECCVISEHSFLFLRKGCRVIKMAKTDNRKRYGNGTLEETKELVKELQKKAEDLGRKPIKEDLEPEELARIRKCFGKWCYELEAAGFQKPSEETLERRKNKTDKWNRIHAAAKKRRAEIYRNRIERADEQTKKQEPEE